MRPPSSPFSAGTGFSDISGDFVCAGCAAINNTNINNTAFNAGDKLFHVFWTGVKYAVTDNLDLMGAYYHYDQPAFGAAVNCANAAAFANCHGTFDAVSFVADWQFAKKFDAYAGLMFSQVNGGLANGFLHRNSIDPTVGLRFRFREIYRQGDQHDRPVLHLARTPLRWGALRVTHNPPLVRAIESRHQNCRSVTEE